MEDSGAGALRDVRASVVLSHPHTPRSDGCACSSATAAATATATGGLGLGLGLGWAKR
jgi:hypothetical protein